MKRIKFVDEVRSFWRWWSIRLGLIGTALTAYLIASPDAALQAWALLPADLKAAVPPQYVPMIGVGVFVLSMLARTIRQPKLQKPDEGPQ